MSSTMEDFRSRLDEARKAVTRAKQHALDVERDVLRFELISIGDAFPQVERVGFNAYWEYDDEGSYYWSVSPQVRLAGDDDDMSADDLYNENRDLYKVLEGLHEYDHEAWVAVIPDADSEHGMAKIEDLRNF